MTTMQHVNIALNIFCSIVCLVILIIAATSENRKDKLNRIYCRIVIGNTLLLLTDVVRCMALGRTQPNANVILRVSLAMVFMYGPILLIFFTEYILTFLKRKTTISKVAQYMAYIAVAVCVVDIMCIILTQFNRMYYMIDESSNVIRQDWFMLGEISSFICIALNTGIIIKYRKNIDRREFISMLSYAVLPAAAVFVQITINEIGVIYYAITLAILIFYMGIQSDQAKQLKQKELELANARVDIMLSQIQPHFLYNTLATIEVLCHDDSAAAANMVHDFSNYLRENMDSLTQKELVDFNREVEHIKIYLDIEKLRLRERLTVVYDLEATDFQLPILTVQPLVENAVRYGVSKRRFGGMVTIGTCHVPDGVKITISDDGVGFDSTIPKKQDERSHIGIENVRERLHSQCRGTLTVESEIDKGTVCTIIVPQGGTRA